jgi:hypothetical protein
VPAQKRVLIERLISVIYVFCGAANATSLHQDKHHLGFALSSSFLELDQDTSHVVTADSIYKSTVLAKIVANNLLVCW